MKNSSSFRCILTGNRVRKHRSTSGSLCWCRFTRFSSPSRRHSCHTASSRKHTCSKDHDSFLGDGPVLSLSNLAGLALTFTRVFASRVTFSGGLSLSRRAWKVLKSTTSSLRISFRLLRWPRCDGAASGRQERCPPLAETAQCESGDLHFPALGPALNVPAQEQADCMCQG